MTYSAEQLKWSMKVENLSNENEDLRKNLSQLRENYRAETEDQDCIRRSIKEKDKEWKEPQKSITKLLRTCSEKNEDKVKKLQMEQIRLTVVELALRRELESCRLEVDSLRHENIDLLNSLNGTTNDIGALTFKLDKEIRNRICCLQDQGLSMLNESTHLSSKLIEFIKGKASHNQLRVTQQGLDGQFLIESDMKVWGFKRRIQNLTRNLETIPTLVHKKFSSVASNSHLTSMNPDVSTKLNKQSSEELTRTEIKTERLLTSLLREKLYSKELEVEQLQAEVSAAMLKKDEIESRLRNDIQESMKELAILRGVLPKVSQERDLMWEEVKQYFEKNMVLNSEINALKKIEGLDEDILLKEGQITILKDTLNNNNKSFDLLGSVDSISEFLLQ
ncbi:hypothetical protein Goshw_003476 [Gossypium schwendimanii]|uniref:DUF7653 domain-containing protein n=1 Tax=Gossypium schwendimanii TaxID=34291 RepID=A0A7J9MAA8_GOSSC|nr:hypothetical protein [Gossypium schwendimanii]